MNNAELNQFAHIPTNQTLKRSIFDLSHSNKLTARVGDMIPFECIEIMPGDTFKVNQSQLLRSITPANPTMDNAYVDFFYFFVPFRLCFLDDNYKLDQKIWEQINGENTKSFWANTDEVEAHMEQIKTIEPQSICDYLGMPIGDFEDSKQYYNPAPVVAVGLIWNEFFRDQNLQAPIVDWQSFITNVATVECLKVAKFHDYFTSALPAPQKGDPVGLNLTGFAPIIADNEGYAPVGYMENGSHDPVRFYASQTEMSGGETGVRTMYNFNTHVDGSTISRFGNMLQRDQAGGAISGDIYVTNADHFTAVANLASVEPKADLSKADSNISINDIRLAFAAQKMLERDARSGTRFIEQLRARWNIVIKDETLQRPQYIGGKRIPLNIEQVNQTSETSSDSPLGRSGAFSLTTGQNISFTASFKEQGYLIGIMCIRLANTYKKGLPIMFSRKNRLQWYNPEMANIGEQSIYNKELFLDEADHSANDETYGYKEAWSEYRYEQNKLKGKFKDPNDLMLATWTYAQEFNTLPTLNANFITQTRAPFLKTLAVEDTDYDYIVDIYENISAARPMPTYSIPSLIDHN